MTGKTPARAERAKKGSSCTIGALPCAPHATVVYLVDYRSVAMVSKRENRRGGHRRNRQYSYGFAQAHGVLWGGVVPFVYSSTSPFPTGLCKEEAYYPIL